MRRLHATWKEEKCHLQKLRSFCLAAQTGSFSKAAEMVSLSQPAVSLQIQTLEQAFDAPLFHRRGPKISLTPEGQALYELAWPLVKELDALFETFRAGQQGLETGTLSIAAGESTILYLLPDYVKDYHQKHPGVELRLHNVTGRDGLQLLRRDGVDFAVGPMIEVPDDLEYHPLFTYDPMLIVPRDHPLASRKRVTIKEIAACPLILPPQHLSTWRVVDYVFQKHNLHYRVSLEAGGWEVIKRYVEIGLGVSIVMSLCLKGTENLTAINISQHFPRRAYGVVTRRRRPLSPAALRFIEMLKGPRPQSQTA